jgi:hypothetical protein
LRADFQQQDKIMDSNACHRADPVLAVPFLCRNLIGAAVTSPNRLTDFNRPCKSLLHSLVDCETLQYLVQYFYNNNVVCFMLYVI